MSMRSRSKPWFRTALTAQEIERSAQIQYGWPDWNDPFQKALEQAESRASFESVERVFYDWAEAVSSGFVEGLSSGGRAYLDGELATARREAANRLRLVEEKSER